MVPGEAAFARPYRDAGLLPTHPCLFWRACLSGTPEMEPDRCDSVPAVRVGLGRSPAWFQNEAGFMNDGVAVKVWADQPPHAGSERRGQR